MYLYKKPSATSVSIPAVDLVPLAPVVVASSTTRIAPETCDPCLGGEPVVRATRIVPADPFQCWAWPGAGSRASRVGGAVPARQRL